MLKSFRKKVLGIVVAGMLVTSLGSYYVYANHNFADVPTGAFYHDSVEWIVNRGITGGCAPGVYCPADAVTRASMAVFLRFLGVALTPRVLKTDCSPGAYDLDATLNQCPSASYTPTFTQQAVVCGQATVFSSTALQISVFPTVSVNGGAFGFAGSGNFDRNHLEANQWTTVQRCSTMDLATGSSYVFAVRPMRESGTGDPTDSRALTLVTIYNRNPATSPLEAEVEHPVPVYDTDRRR